MRVLYAKKSDVFERPRYNLKPTPHLVKLVEQGEAQKARQAAYHEGIRDVLDWLCWGRFRVEDDWGIFEVKLERLKELRNHGTWNGQELDENVENWVDPKPLEE